MEVRYLYKEGRYVVKEKLSNGQTLFMSFDMLEETNTTVYFNVVLGVFNKRKHASRNESEKRITGTAPFETIAKAIKAFNMLEEAVQDERRKSGLCIVVDWVDNRRRDAYYKVLSKRGYHYSTYEGRKVLMKRFTRL